MRSGAFVETPIAIYGRNPPKLNHLRELAGQGRQFILQGPGVPDDRCAKHLPDAGNGKTSYHA
jgi:hypothetical protein